MYERGRGRREERANQGRSTDNNLFNAMTFPGRFLLQSPTVTKALNSSKNQCAKVSLLAGPSR